MEERDKRKMNIFFLKSCVREVVSSPVALSSAFANVRSGKVYKCQQRRPVGAWDPQGHGTHRDMDLFKSAINILE